MHTLTLHFQKQEVAQSHHVISGALQIAQRPEQRLDYDDHKDDFASVELAGVSKCKYCMPYENDVNIFLCRGFKYNIKEAWQHEKHYD